MANENIVWSGHRLRNTVWWTAIIGCTLHTVKRDGTGRFVLIQGHEYLDHRVLGWFRTAKEAREFPSKCLDLREAKEVQ